MRVLIAEDDFASRKYMLRMLSQYGNCDVTVDGEEAVEAFSLALEDNEPYDLVCLDIMMPVKDGYEVLAQIRQIEKMFHVTEEKKTKVIMTSALHEAKNVMKAFELGCESYAGKPIDEIKLINAIKKLGIVIGV